MSESKVTRCPHCHTSFRIKTQQLDLAQGAVRCGSCLQVFDASQYLIEPTQPAPKDDLPSPTETAVADESLPHGLQRLIQAHQQKHITKKQSSIEPIDDLSTVKSGDDAFAMTITETRKAEAQPHNIHVIPQAQNDDDDTSIHQQRPLKDADFEADDDDFELDSPELDKSELNGSELDDSQSDQIELDKVELDETGSDAKQARNNDEVSAALPEISPSPLPNEAIEHPKILDDIDDPFALDPFSLPEHELPEQSMEFVANDGSEGQQTQCADPEYDTDTDPTLEIAINHDDAIDGSRPFDNAYDFIDEPVHFSQAKRTKVPTSIFNGWLVAAIAMITLLMAQLAYFKFDQGVRHPSYRPFYQTLCARLGCQLPLIQDITQMSTQHLVVRSHPKVKNALYIDTLIYNNATDRQPFPDIALMFTNLENQVIASRLFSPQEYLAGDLKGAYVMPVQTPIHIAVEIQDPGAEAVGYHIELTSNVSD